MLILRFFGGKHNKLTCPNVHKARYWCVLHSDEYIGIAQTVATNMDGS